MMVALASTVGSAQTRGGAVYSTTCKMCHGPTGEADTPTARMLNVKPVSDPYIKGLTEDQMFLSIRNGKGKMKPMPSLSDSQIKDSVFYFRSLIK
jgi:mono/diheme cytochrome c family protein